MFCLASLSLDTGHCTSSFISRLFSNLSSHRSETHFFRLSICPTPSVWLSISLFVNPPMCHSFPFCTVILLPISGVALSLMPLLISLIWLFYLSVALCLSSAPPPLLFSLIAISAAGSPLIFQTKSQCKDKNTRCCRYVLISISFCLSLSLGAPTYHPFSSLRIW